MRSRIFLFLAPTLFLAGLLTPVFAYASNGLTIQPIKIDQTLNPGDTYEGSVLVTNAGDSATDVELSVQDFIPVAGADTYQFVGRAPGVTTVRDWITVDSKTNFSLNIGEAKNVPFKITAPSNAEPGGHFGVVFFKATPEGGVAGSLKVGTQLGMLVLITIPGSHLEKGQILSFSAPYFNEHGPVPFSIKFQNTGTVHFEPKGSIVITNMFGQKAGEVPVTGQIALPSSIKDLSYQWRPGPFSVGRYSATATMYDGDGNALTSDTISFWIVPVWYIFGFIVILGLVYFVLRFIKRHVRIV